MRRGGPGEPGVGGGRGLPKPRGREEARPQDPGDTLRWDVGALRVEVGSLRERVEAVEGVVLQG